MKYSVQTTVTRASKRVVEKSMSMKEAKKPHAKKIHKKAIAHLGKERFRLNSRNNTYRERKPIKGAEITMNNS